MSFELPKLPVLPEINIPTPFGSVSLPEQKIKLPSFPPIDERSRGAMGHAIGIDLAMIPSHIPAVGRVVADVIRNLHSAEVRKLLTAKQYDSFLRHNKLAPTTIAMAQTLTEGD